ncbi:methyl-accepting chemotaxis protein [Simplicispira psychrophila]|uniref:methyl-accepting chemotaxis protein n=1 Tax=Simplicispira psychrophila TaxID=80882 RepID=UPI000A03B32F|nr:methyl-accepting chemotaxis protein [Simplicispira psychrophila]
MGALLSSTLVLSLAALAWPAWSVPWDGLHEAALLCLTLMALAGVVGSARSGRRWWGGSADAGALGRLDKHALDVTVNNASMMSSFTRVVSASREQSSVLGQLLEGVGALDASVASMVQSAAITRNEVHSMHELAVHGDGLLNQTMERIAALEPSAQGLEERFREVMRHKDEIENIVDLIQKVAMQTNLLSLNAAIEAARAGEQGRGFTVVAQEVRKLSTRTNDATVQIRQMISGITTSTVAADSYLQQVLQDIHGGIERTRETGAALADIRARSGRTLNAANDLAVAAQTQGGLSQRLVQNAQALSAAAQQSVEWLGTSNGQLRTVQGLIGQLKRETSQLLPGRAEVDVLADCIEELRACNILVMNADAYRDIVTVVERIGQLDTLIDSTWARYLRSPRGHAPAAPAQQFAAALKAYRGVRGEVLALAKAERFDQVRAKVPLQVRPAYDLVKNTLSHLSTPDPSAASSGGWRQSMGKLFQSH